MQYSEHFYRWVAKTITELGGNGDQYLRGLGDECPLTYAATRVVDCQELFCPLFKAQIQGFMPCAVIVPTNVMSVH